MIASSNRFSGNNLMDLLNPPVVAVVGLSGSGKTTLIVGLVKELQRLGLRVATIKHHLHDFEMDKPGKDTWLHRRAGAFGTVLSTPHSIGMVRDVDHDHTPQELAVLLPGADIILAEGYKNSKTPKIEVFRQELSSAPLNLDDPTLMAIVSETDVDWEGPRFSPDDFADISHMLMRRFMDPTQ